MKAPSSPQPPEALPRAVQTDRHGRAESSAGRFLSSLLLLARTRRMYHKDHPKIEESLFATERSLRDALGRASSVAVRLESGAMYFRGRPLDDPRGELRALADELGRRGISALTFRSETHTGELIAFLELVDSQSGGSSSSSSTTPAAWERRLASRSIVGIRVNEAVADSRPDPMLPHFLAAVLEARGQNSSTAQAAAALPADARIFASLQLLGNLAATLPGGLGSSPDDARNAAHSMESALASADRGSVLLLAREMKRCPPQGGETLESYFARLAEDLAVAEATEEFRAGTMRPVELRRVALAVGRQVAALEDAHPLVLAPLARWAADAGAAEFESRFWALLTPDETAKVLRSTDAWCVPPSILRDVLLRASSTAGLREARAALLAFSKGLEAAEGDVRQATAAGLADLDEVLLHYWPEQLPEEFGQRVLRALVAERKPAIAALLVVIVERMADAALHKSRYVEFDSVLKAFEEVGFDVEPDAEHLALLKKRLCEGERWELLLSGALAHRPLDPALTRILARQPEPVIDALMSVLSSGNGESAPAVLATLPAMVRLTKAIGDPAIAALAARVFEKRIGRATAAVKLLAAVRPQLLVDHLPGAFPNWDWSVQDLAISELARQRVDGLSTALLAVLPQAHLYVVPMVLDLLGQDGDPAAVPALMEVAAGEDERLRDVFIRIKAIEALGRQRAPEAAPLLRGILRTRNGLLHSEPAGLRTAAEEALEAIEGRMPRSRLLEQLDAAASSGGAARPRRYPRFPLDSPLSARIEGKRPMSVQVSTISLGGACIASTRQLAIGDAFPMEIKSGLRTINAMAVVRNVLPNGTGVEFVHMGQEDREKLRKLLRGLKEE